MDKRLGRLLLVVAVLLVVMIAPLLFLNNQLGGGGVDPNYRALSIYGRALSGDVSADTQAAEIYPSLKVIEKDGEKIYLRGSGDSCWKLEPSKSYEPVKTDKEACE